MNWKTILSFVLFATLLTLLVGWLTATRVLPLEYGIQYDDRQLNFFRIWIGLAIAIGAILPAIAWFIWRDRPSYQRIFGFYLTVLVIQIITEQLASSIIFPSMVVTIGTLYTLFRIWQIWQGYRSIQTEKDNSAIAILLGILGLYWVGNSIFLFTIGWPSILS
jgi:hypothetical protein